jgi:hypothetical protein
MKHGRLYWSYKSETAGYRVHTATQARQNHGILERWAVSCFQLCTVKPDFPLEQTDIAKYEASIYQYRPLLTTFSLLDP